MDKQYEVMTIKELEAALVLATLETSAWEKKSAEAELKLWDAGQQALEWRIKKNQLMWQIMTRKVEMKRLQGNDGSILLT